MSQTFKIPYGDSHLSFQVPGTRPVHVLRPQGHEPEDLLEEQDIVEAALAGPIASAGLSELARGKRKVVVVTSDHTRPLPSRLTLPPMLREIRKGSPDAEIVVLVGVGSHRGMTREEMIAKFGREFVDRERIVNHDPRDMTNLVSLGAMPSGGDLVLNRLAVEADLLVADGFIEPHQFAGFSGGRKSIMPGIAGLKTVLASHNAEFTVHPCSRPGNLEGNPFHIDMTDAARQAGLAFILNVCLSPEKRIIAAFAGKPETAHLEGCRFVEKLCAVPAVESSVVIASNGGYPLDQNIYQSTKSVMAADLVCAPGGVIISVNECRDGHGAEGFYRDFQTAGSLESLLRDIRSRGRDETRPDQWVTQLVADILSRRTVIYVTKAPREIIETMGMVYASSVEQALEIADSMIGSEQSSITLLPEAVTLILKK